MVHFGLNYCMLRLLNRLADADRRFDKKLRQLTDGSSPKKEPRTKKGSGQFDEKNCRIPMLQNGVFVIKIRRQMASDKANINDGGRSFTNNQERLEEASSLP